MVNHNINLQKKGVKESFPRVDLYYTDPVPVFNFTSVQLSPGVTATSGIVLVSTLDPLDPRYGIIAELNLSTSGTGRVFTEAYSTKEEDLITITGAEGLYRRKHD